MIAASLPSPPASNEAVSRVLVRYARGVDRCDETLIASVYYGDSYDEHGSFRGTGAEFAKWEVALLSYAFEATSHRMSNADIALRGDEARVESYVLAHYKTRAGEGDAKLVVVGARYLDRFQRLEGEWKISRRVVVVDWSRLSTVEETFPSEGYRLGARLPGDPSYED